MKRPDVAALMKKLAYKPAEANRTFGVLRKMFNLAEVWGCRPDGTNPCRHVPMYPPGKDTRLIVDDELVRTSATWRSWRPRDWKTTSSRWRSACNSSSPARRSEICLLRMGLGRSAKSAASSGRTARPAAYPSP